MFTLIHFTGYAIRELVNKTSRLAEFTFIVRMLYKDIY